MKFKYVNTNKSAAYRKLSNIMNYFATPIDQGMEYYDL
jgi:hypothetical protein